jgi:hypothetical protein
MSSANLVLRYNDLSTVSVIRSWNGMFQKTDGPDNLSFFDGPEFAIPLRQEVAGIANDLLRLHRLSFASNTDELSVAVSYNRVNRLVQHIGTAVYSA